MIFNFNIELSEELYYKIKHDIKEAQTCVIIDLNIY